MDEITFREPKLKEIYQKIYEAQPGNLQLQAIMTKKNKEGEHIWSVRDTRITESLASVIKKNALNYLESHAEVEVKDFDVTGDQSDEYLVEKLPDSEVPVLNKIISEMNRRDNEDISYDELAKSSYLSGFAIIFSPTLIIFNKITRNTLFKPKKYLFFIPSSTGEFKEIEEENLLSVPTSIDTILYEDPLFIFNKKNFIKLFRYEDAFDHFITSGVNSLDKIVDNVNGLIDYSKPDLRNYIKLASACAGFVERIVQTGINLEPIAIDYKFKIAFSNGKIDIQNSVLTDVLKLLNGQAMKDALFEDKYIAQERTKVQ